MAIVSRALGRVAETQVLKASPSISTWRPHGLILIFITFACDRQTFASNDSLPVHEVAPCTYKYRHKAPLAVSPYATSLKWQDVLVYSTSLFFPSLKQGDEVGLVISPYETDFGTRWA
jgi:hypothetical protein